MSASTAPVNRPSEGSVRLVVTLGLAGLLSGLAIAGTYQATLPRVRANQAAALRAAVFEVVPGSTSLRPLVERGGELVAVDVEPGAKPPDSEVYAAYDDDGSLRGYAITGEGAGFQDTIRLIFGFDPAARNVVGMQVLESRETPGLGDRIYKDADFVGGFRALSPDPEVMLVKKGSKSAPNEVDGITGATISAKAVVRIINGAAGTWIGRLPAADVVEAAGEETP